MTEAEIIKAVRLNLDEGRAYGNESELQSAVVSTLVDDETGSYVDNDEKTLDELITSVIPEAVYYVYMNADESMLDPLLYGNSVVQFNAAVTDNKPPSSNVYCATVFLDRSKFRRFVSARFASWLHAVDEPILNTDKAYAMQGNPTVSGSWERPVVVLTPRMFDPTSNKYLTKIEMFGPKNISDSLSMYCLGVPEKTSDGNWPICSEVERAVVYYATSLVMNVLHDPKADDMATLAHMNMGRGDAIANAEGVPQQKG